MEKTDNATHLNRSYWVLKLVYGLVPIVAGLDKFTNLLTDWKQYLSPLVVNAIPFPPATFMYAVGVIEIVAGILVLSRLTRVGAYVVSAWLFCIALNLVTTGGFFDIAVRDLAMSVGAFVLGELAAIHVPSPRKTASRHETRTLQPS